MTVEELKTNLREILTAEDRPVVDWRTVDCLIDKTLQRLTSEAQPNYPYNTVFPFLDDSKIRQKELEYAQVQRERLRAWLNETN